MKTPGSRKTLASLLLLVVLTLPLQQLLYHAFEPHDWTNSEFACLLAATCVHGILTLPLAVGFTRLWRHYPERVSLWNLWRGLAGRHAGLPCVSVVNAVFAIFMIIAGMHGCPANLGEVPAGALLLNWLYVSLSIGAISGVIR